MANTSPIFLRHARIADRYRHASQRKPKDVVDGTKCGRQREIVLARLRRRVKRDRRRLVRPPEIPTAVMFPLDAEAHSMCAALPSEDIAQMEAASKIAIRRRVTDKQECLRDVD